MEASKGAEDKLPKNFEKEDLHAFNIDDRYEHLLRTQPILVHSIAGVVMSHQGSDEIQVNVEKFENSYFNFTEPCKSWLWWLPVQ